MDADTGGRLRGVITKLSRQLNASAAGEGLTPSQASALGLIAFRGPLSLAELASIEGLNPTMVSRIVGKLDDSRLIRRVADANDMRRASVEVTPDGDQLNELIKSKRGASVAEAFNRLTPDEQESVLSALSALESLAKELGRKPHNGSR